MSPQTSNSAQAQVDQELLQRTFCDGERCESLTTTKMPWERNRGEISDKDDEPTPRTLRSFEEKPREEGKNTSSVDYQLRARKPSDPKPSNTDIDRNTRNHKRGKYHSTSSSDSEGQEENEKILRFQRKRSNLEEEESTMTRLQSNGADRNSRSVTRDYEEDNKTWRSLTGEEKISHTGRSNILDKVAGKQRENAEGDKDFIPRNRRCLKEGKSHTHSDGSDSDGEQEVKRRAHEGRGGVKHQGTSLGNTDRQQRSRSRSAESDRDPSIEKNRKSRHHHHHHRHRRHHHRHNRNRSPTPSESRAVKQRKSDSTT